MDEKLEKVKEILKKYNQEQLLICYDRLIEQKREELCDQILKINFEEIQELYNETKSKKTFKEGGIEPLPYIDKEKLSKEEKEQYENIGINKIKEGR